MAENKEELSIEEMFDRLDGIMRTLEDSRSTLEESFASYEAAVPKNARRQARPLPSPPASTTGASCTDRPAPCPCTGRQSF